MQKILKIRTEICMGTYLECQPQTYSLFRTNDGSYLIRHWKLCEDGKRRSTKYPVKANKIDPILKILLQLTLPIAPVADLGCDGGYTELELGDYGGGSKFRWWSCPPAGWEELDELTYSILELIDDGD